MAEHGTIEISKIWGGFLLESRPSMTTTKHHNYDEDKIKSLSSLEHIRMRTGMYIGRIGDGSDYDDGFYILLKEVIDNAIDEFIMGYGDRIAITLEGTKVTVRDFGRGIPLGKVVECVSQINTGAKYNDEVFQFSVGLNGVGTKAVNALSAQFHGAQLSRRRVRRGRLRAGKLLNEQKGKDSGRTRRHARQLRAGPGNLRIGVFCRRTCRAPAAALLLPEQPACASSTTARCSCRATACSTW